MHTILRAIKCKEVIKTSNNPLLDPLYISYLGPYMESGTFKGDCQHKAQIINK